MESFKRLLLCLCSLFFIPSSLSAQEWSRFRGPNGAGLAKADLPVSWTDKDYLWKVQVPGQGHSSPVLWGGKLFLTSGDNKTGKRKVLCYSAADGKKLWDYEVPGSSYKLHKRNSVATATPVVDDRAIYVAWGSPNDFLVLALDHQGKELWKKELGTYDKGHGFGVSPIRVNDLLILTNDQDGPSSLIALKAATGETAWQVPRKNSVAHYSSPVVYQPKGRDAEIIFTNWQHGITAVEAKSGKVAWEISCFEPDKQERAIASPIVAGDLVLGTCGFITAQKHFVAVRPTTAGKAEEVWRFEKAVSHMGTPVVVGDRIFLFSERGFATCLDAKTGNVVWQERVDGVFSSSPVCAGDRIYAAADNGDVFVVKAADKFELLALNPLGEGTQSTPAIAHGRIYFRTFGHLICLGKR